MACIKNTIKIYFLHKEYKSLRNLILFLSILSSIFFTELAYSAKWVEVSRSDQGDIHYIDIDSIIINESITYWVKTLYKNKTKQPSQVFKHKGKVVAFSKSKNSEFCTSKKSITTDNIFYGAQHEVLGSYQLTEKDLYKSYSSEPTSIVPETVGETIHNFVCSFQKKANEDIENLFLYELEKEKYEQLLQEGESQTEYSAKEIASLIKDLNKNINDLYINLPSYAKDFILYKELHNIFLQVSNASTEKSLTFNECEEIKTKLKNGLVEIFKKKPLVANGVFKMPQYELPNCNILLQKSQEDTSIKDADTSFEKVDYLRKLTNRIIRNYHPPLNSTKSTVIKFIIAKDGHLSSHWVTHSSGDYSSDASAMNAISLSAPYPYLPSSFLEKEVVFSLKFPLTYTDLPTTENKIPSYYR